VEVGRLLSIQAGRQGLQRGGWLRMQDRTCQVTTRTSLGTSSDLQVCDQRQVIKRCDIYQYDVTQADSGELQNDLWHWHMFVFAGFTVQWAQRASPTFLPPAPWYNPYAASLLMLKRDSSRAT
jgi:hypothetical protein